MDWIDRERERRLAGLTRPLSQAAHAAVNARHPGTTLEYCCECEEPTGRAGRDEDSLYDGEDGPYCQPCYDDLFVGDAIVAELGDRRPCTLR